MKNFLKKFREDSFRQELWEREAKIIVAVSGGPDSACLLDVFCELRKKYALELIIAHVNYNLRGKDSAGDEKFVLKLAEKYGLEAEILRPKIKSKKNLENNLRDIRYAFLEKIRYERDFHWIAVGHNLDDQAETFLQRLIRGAGMRGLCGMQFKNGKIIRPLLGFLRCEISEYLKLRKLKYRTDKTNQENIFLRNRIRHQLLPYLEKNFNPRFRETLFQTAVSLGEDYALIENWSQEFFQKNRDLSVKKILSLPKALQKRIILKFLREISGQLKNVESAHLEEILKIFKSRKNKNQNIHFQGLKIERKGDKVTIVKKMAEECEFSQN
ncbi:MAG: tRNA lysidine(34) synthetase TilS [Candidatus Moranbacteria bacterium CG_4_9_14_3_um_filter_40_7]|nr:MAG: tRNA lysidine(34) synthetase TilS [Candidatus Moranbacteria bacterium CG23_combo_of_CG06-09_8_20_14_all_40_16]PIU81057.1 MAG: tRNA lysidine(34) synthetase TilS [Candidatus Moranbacteria bacterium CG06_land_8_20_14_3_00_40_12]PJA88027.1 MAG: tRNA lysidine(34) synthetase TilS [Candidatus Moranbacteria bacterium CG_4_9_14_3_um_filter_40_7]